MNTGGREYGNMGICLYLNIRVLKYKRTIKYKKGSNRYVDMWIVE